MQRAVWRAQENLSNDSDSSDEDSLKSDLVPAKEIQANTKGSSENLKEKKKPGVQKPKEDDITEGSQRAYEWIMVRTKKVEEDCESALLSSNLEIKME